ncbi:Isonitrile hydratase [Nocardiopsis dassonvillei]|uniref:DJ-1/PfpI family protein n=1 Tax=Nocardiopsis dassonvillei TaxID=2014 RepID=UPI003F57B3B1
MRLAVVLFEGVTALDAIGPYEVLGSLPGVETVFVGERRGPVRASGGGAGLVVQAELGEVDTADVVVVPGGPGQAHQMEGALVEWIGAVDAGSRWTASVCTGSLILAASGVLAGRRAATHWLAGDELERWGVEHAVGERVVFDGKYVTAAGVSAGIDMGLALAGELVGEFGAQMVQLALEYDPAPPFGAGSPERAPAEVVGLARESRRFLLWEQDRPGWA